MPDTVPDASGHNRVKTATEVGTRDESDSPVRTRLASIQGRLGAAKLKVSDMKAPHTPTSSMLASPMSRVMMLFTKRPRVKPANMADTAEAPCSAVAP